MKTKQKTKKQTKTMDQEVISVQNDLLIDVYKRDLLKKHLRLLLYTGILRDIRYLY